MKWIFVWFGAWVAVVLAFYLLWGRRHSLLARGDRATDAAPAASAQPPRSEGPESGA